MTSLRSHPIVRQGATSFGYLPPDTLSSSSSSCPPLCYRFGRLSPQSSHLMAGILHQMCQSVLKLLICLLSSHMASTRSFPASSHVNGRLWCLTLVLRAVSHLPHGHWFEHYCCLQSLQLRPLPSQLSLSPQPQRWSMMLTPEKHTNLSLSYCITWIATWNAMGRDKHTGNS